MKSKYTKEVLQEAVNNSLSMRNVLRQLNLIPRGGNCTYLKKVILQYGISIDHFLGQGINKGKIDSKRKLPSEYLIKNSNLNSHKVKLRILRDKIKNHVCEECNLEKWLGKAIPLELHHIDGDSTNNTITNLKLLCPNCHALTENHGGKGIKNSSKKH